MAKAAKQKPVEPSLTEEQPTEEVLEQPKEQEQEPLFVPDIPAQMEEPKVQKVTEEKPDTDEVLFLRRILQIQEEGGFGKHLHDLINERIKSLK